MKRKNKIVVILFFVFGITVSATAQSRKGLITPFRKGSMTLNLGVGFGTDYKNEFRSSSAIGTKAALEFGIWQAGPGVISLGIEGGATASNRTDRYYRDDFRARTIVFAGRSAWHYGWRVPGLDTYAGLSGGVGFHHYEYYDNRRYDDNEVFPVIGGFVGVSYFFTPSFGVNAEAGFDITSIQGGVIFKLK